MNEVTKRLLSAFTDDFPAPMFLTSKFRAPAENFYNGQTVTVDIERSDEAMAIAIQDIAAGSQLNKNDIFTNKEFKAPVLSESMPLNVFDMMKREPGNDPFVDPNFQASASMRALKGMRKMVKKIRRSVEFQAAQIFQTGAFTYVDSAGNTIFTVDFSPKTTHMINAALVWSNASADPLLDLENMCDVIRKDSGRVPDQVIMGSTSFREFLNNSIVKETLDNRRMERGGITSPQAREQGAKYQGVIAAGSYELEIYTYPEFVNDVQTPATKNPYISAENVVVLSSQARFDATYGTIPRLGTTNADALPYLPQIEGNGTGMALSSFAYLNNPKTALMLEVGNRPLLIPTEIDGFGRIAT